MEVIHTAIRLAEPVFQSALWASIQDEVSIPTRLVSRRLKRLMIMGALTVESDSYHKRRFAVAGVGKTALRSRQRGRPRGRASLTERRTRSPPPQSPGTTINLGSGLGP